MQAITTIEDAITIAARASQGVSSLYDELREAARLRPGPQWLSFPKIISARSDDAAPTERA